MIVRIYIYTYLYPIQCIIHNILSHIMYHTLYIHICMMYIYIHIMSTYIHTSCNVHVHVYLICRLPPHRSFIESARPFWFPQEPSGMRDLARYGGRVVGSAQIRGKKVGEGWASRVFLFIFGIFMLCVMQGYAM